MCIHPVFYNNIITFTSVLGFCLYGFKLLSEWFEELPLVFLVGWVGWQQILYLCLSGNVCISFSFLKYGFTKYKILGWKVFLFVCLLFRFWLGHPIAFWPPLFLVKSFRWDVTLIAISLYVICHSSLDTFKIFSLFLASNIFTTKCPRVDHFTFIYIEFVEFLDVHCFLISFLSLFSIGDFHYVCGGVFTGFFHSLLFLSVGFMISVFKLVNLFFSQFRYTAETL